MHVFPQLRKLKHKYRYELAVIGVHSPKFTSEKDTENLRMAVLRYQVEHPVVNDAGFAVWGLYSGRAWPSMVFLDPQGRVIGKHEGEITFEQFDPIISQMVEEEGASALSFPGKVLADEASGRLFIADSNHNRKHRRHTGRGGRTGRGQW